MSEEQDFGGADPEELIGLLRGQLELYRRLKMLAERQRDLICREDPKPLLSLLVERQKVVDELNGLSAHLASAQETWRDQYRSIAAEKRREAEELLQDVANTLRSILWSDEEDSRMLAARMSQTAREVQVVGTTQRAFQAYSGSKEESGGAYSKTDESA